jgi:hypothetical protein
MNDQFAIRSPAGADQTGTTILALFMLFVIWYARVTFSATADVLSIHASKNKNHSCVGLYVKSIDEKLCTLKKVFNHSPFFS